MQLLDCLNPCFNGRYSRSLALSVSDQPDTEVLILVLMEDTLGDKWEGKYKGGWKS